jgi:hypothetical protein
MASINPPIFVVTESDGVEAYKSVGATLAHLEPWYVQQFVPQLFDSTGRRLTLEGDGPFQISLADQMPGDAEAFSRMLAEAIIRYVTRIQVEQNTKKLVEVFSKLFIQF